MLRQILNADGQSYIETVPRLGYRFTAGVRVLEARQELVLEKQTYTRTVTEVEEERVDDDRSSSAMPLNNSTRNSVWTRRRAVAVAIAAAYLLSRGNNSFPGALASCGKQNGYGSCQSTVTELDRRVAFQSDRRRERNEYLSVGLADALITRLGNVRQIVVRPTSAIRQYTEATQIRSNIGRRKGVDAVLDGSFQHPVIACE